MNAHSVPALKSSDGLDGVAEIHAQYLQDSGKMSHNDGQGLSSFDRVQKYCNTNPYGLAVAENIGNDFDRPGRNHAL